MVAVTAVKKMAILIVVDFYTSVYSRWDWKWCYWWWWVCRGGGGDVGNERVLLVVTALVRVAVVLVLGVLQLSV